MYSDLSKRVFQSPMDSMTPTIGLKIQTIGGGEVGHNKPTLFNKAKLNPWMYTEIHIRGRKAWCRFISWYVNGRIHTPYIHNQPSDVIGSSRVKLHESLHWYHNNKPHRPSIDGIEQPATVPYDNGTGETIYHQHDMIHRSPVDGVEKPALVLLDYQVYYHMDRLHRVSGPAEVRFNGRMMTYCQQGVQHRDPIDGIDQPAFVSYLEGDYTRFRFYEWGKCVRSVDL